MQDGVYVLFSGFGSNKLLWPSVPLDIQNVFVCGESAVQFDLVVEWLMLLQVTASCSLICRQPSEQNLLHQWHIWEPRNFKE